MSSDFLPDFATLLPNPSKSATTSGITFCSPLPEALIPDAPKSARISKKRKTAVKKKKWGCWLLYCFLVNLVFVAICHQPKKLLVSVDVYCWLPRAFVIMNLDRCKAKIEFGVFPVCQSWRDWDREAPFGAVLRTISKLKCARCTCSGN